MTHMKFTQSSNHLVLIITFVCGSVLLSCSTEEPEDTAHNDIEYWSNLYDWSIAETWNEPYNWSENKIISFTYSGHFGPTGFYTEDRERGFTYYENTISTQDNECPDDDCWIEHSTNDRDSAFAWSQLSALNSSQYRSLESELENEKYFEFRRINEENSSDVMLSRVHKTSYLDRSMYDLFHRTDIIGVFNHKPMNAISVREVIEYLWANDKIERPGSVMSSTVSEDQNYLMLTFLSAFRVGGDWGTCDTIYLRETVVSIEKASGAISFAVQELSELSGVCH